MIDKNKSYYIDFDGVILDTMKIYNNIYKQNNLNDFMKIFDFISYDDIINSKYEINNSLEVLRKIQNSLNVTILTKVNGIEEINKKKDFLLKENINIPLIFVPIEKSKTDFVNVNENTILIDDDYLNIDEWIKCGGNGYLFSNEKIDDYMTVNSLEFLIKKM